MSRPPKRTHEDGTPPPPHGQAATDNEPNKRSRRRKRARHRKKERAQSGRDLSTTEQITPLDLAEMELAVATARLNVARLRVREQGLNEQPAPSTQFSHGKPSLPSTPNGQDAFQEAFKDTDSEVERYSIHEQFSSDLDGPCLPSTPSGQKAFQDAFQETGSDVERYSIHEQFSSDPAEPLHLGSSQAPPPSLGDQGVLHYMVPQKRTAVRGRLSSSDAEVCARQGAGDQLQ